MHSSRSWGAVQHVGLQDSLIELQALQQSCDEVKDLLSKSSNQDPIKMDSKVGEVVKEANQASLTTVFPASPFRIRQLQEETSLKDNLEVPSLSATVKCWEAFRCAEEAAWEVFPDSMLTYGVPQDEQLDLLELYAYPDSRLTECMREVGGRAMRFSQRTVT